MRDNPALGQLTRISACLLLIFGFHSALGGEITVTRTNWTERWITNVIEVCMPVNHFVNQYHTNWIEQVRERVVSVYATNWTTRTLTNRVAVNAFLTNDVVAYKTNLVAKYRTNWTTFNLTNWQTVVVMKTNWIAQPVTNVVQIDLIANRAGATAGPKEGIEPRDDRAETHALPAPAIFTDAVLVQAERTGKPVVNNQVEVRLTVKWASRAPAPFQVQHWRVERQDGAILCFGQDQEFVRELPVGEYKIEVKGRQDENSPLLVARATLSLTAHEAVVQQKMLAKK